MKPIKYGNTVVNAFSVECGFNSRDYFAGVYEPIKVEGKFLDQPFFGKCRTFEKVCKALENKGYEYQEQESLCNGQTIFRFKGGKQ